MEVQNFAGDEDFSEAQMFPDFVGMPEAPEFPDLVGLAGVQDRDFPGTGDGSSLEW